MCKKGHMGVRQFGPRIFLKGFDAFIDALTTSTGSYSAIEKQRVLAMAVITSQVGNLLVWPRSPGPFGRVKMDPVRSSRKPRRN